MQQKKKIKLDKSMRKGERVMTKILHILNSLLPSGAETMLKVAGEYWDKDYEIHILATAEEKGSYAPELEKAGYHVCHIYNRNFINQYRLIKHYIKTNGFDVVHVHTEGKAVYYEMAAFFAGVKNIVRTIHNVFLFNGILQKRRVVTRWVGAHLFKVKHVAISESIRENEKQRFHNECKVINNWYDENKYKYVEPDIKKNARNLLGIKETQIVMISVGNCSDIKNHLSILKALAKIQCNNILYLHIGQGESEILEKEFAQKHDLLSKVRFEGHQEPLIYLQAADFYIMPSRYEGVSIAALEAMAIGMHCIFSDVYGLSDFKKYNLSQISYCELNDEAIKTAIEQEIKKGNRKNSEEQSQRIRELYGIEHGVQEYQKAYFSWRQ